jgi:hypothetical protein
MTVRSVKKFEVGGGLRVWSAAGVSFEQGWHELADDEPEELVQAIRDAHDAQVGVRILGRGDVPTVGYQGRRLNDEGKE